MPWDMTEHKKDGQKRFGSIRGQTLNAASAFWAAAHEGPIVFPVEI